jgi:serpin B
MKKVIIFILVAIMLGGIAACGQPAAGAVLKSDKPRITSPAASQSDIEELVAGNSVFAFDLYQYLIKSNSGNIFYSPYSLSEALAMTYGGARGNTEKEMASALSFLLPQSQLHPAFDALDLALASRGQGAKGTDENGFRLHIVNGIWGQSGFNFLSSYLDLLAQNYGAGLRILDFQKDPESSRVTINDWVSEQTEQKIKDLIPQGSITDMTRLVLTNAIYFNAAWQFPFEKTATQNGDFFLANGDKVSVPMMKQQQQFNYAAGDGYQAVELPYDGQELSMMILLPEEGDFSTFEASLSGPSVAQIIQGLKSKTVNLAMPKFTYSSDFGLRDALISLGAKDAFAPGVADFSGMDGKTDLYIQDVVHKAFIAVDEAGTEAAAASGVIVGTTSMPTGIIKMEIDRPFIYLIRDIQTGAILFIGRVMNPNA